MPSTQTDDPDGLTRGSGRTDADAGAGAGRFVRDERIFAGERSLIYPLSILTVFYELCRSLACGLWTEKMGRERFMFYQSILKVAFKLIVSGYSPPFGPFSRNFSLILPLTTWVTKVSNWVSST